MTAVIVAIGVTARVEAGLLVTVPVPQAVPPPPPVEVAVTVNVLEAGVADVVVTVRVDDVATLVIVGLKLVVTPAGVPPVQFTVTMGVQVAVPVHVVVIEYVAELP